MKECCNIAGVIYSKTDNKQQNIALLLTSDNVEKHLTKIKETILLSGVESNKVNLARVEMPSENHYPRDDVPKELDPYYRTLDNIIKSNPLSINIQKSDVQGLETYAYIGVSNGWAVLHWESPQVENYDWVGIYDSQDKDQNSYLTYQWVKNNTEYISNQYFVSGLSVRYYRYISGKYQELFRTKDLDLHSSVAVPDESCLFYGCWVSPTPKSYVRLNWIYKNAAYYDYIGLFKDNSDKYLTWQWAMGIGHLLLICHMTLHMVFKQAIMLDTTAGMIVQKSTFVSVVLFLLGMHI